MKTILTAIILLSFVSCQEKFELKRKKGKEGDISGTVSFIFNALGASPAYAAGEEALLAQQSDEILKNDFFVQSSGSDYSVVLANSLTLVESFLSSVGTLVSTNGRGFNSSNFPNGIGIAIGFDSNKKIVSLNLVELASDRSYKFSDRAAGQVSFHKLIFLFEQDGVLQYRQSYVFKNGGAITENITFASSAASIKASRDLATDLSLSVQQLKSNVTQYKQIIGENLLNRSEGPAISAFVNALYPDSSSLESIQLDVIRANQLYEMRASPEFNAAVLAVYENWYRVAVITRPQPSLMSYLSGAGADGTLITDTISNFVTELSSSGAIPELSIVTNGGGGLGGGQLVIGIGR